MNNIFATLLSLYVLAVILPMAAVAQCAAPVISSTSGDQVLAGVSVITISADEGALISYTVDGATPSTDIASAQQSPVSFTVSRTGDFTVKAVALNAGSEPSEVSSMFFTSEEADYESIVEYKKGKGSEKLIAGPLVITVVGKVANGYGKGDYWMFMTDKAGTGMAVERTDTKFPDMFSAGKSVDFYCVTYQEPYTSFTMAAYAPKGFRPMATCDAEVAYLDATGQGIGWQQSHYACPVVFRDVKVEDGKVEGLRIYEKFEGIVCDFEDGASYDIYGIIGAEDESTGGHVNAFDCLYLLKAEIASQSPYEANSIAEAFGQESGRRVDFLCDLTVIAVGRDSDIMFVTDDAGAFMTVTGDFTAAGYSPGDIISELSVTTGGHDGVNCATLAGEPAEATASGALPAAKDIEPTSLADNAGGYVTFLSAIRHDAGSGTMSVGGVALNASAIDDEVGAAVMRAVGNYAEGTLFRLTGIVTFGDGNGLEFWLTAIVDENGDSPTTGISSTKVDGGTVKFEDGRAVLGEDSRMVDLLGRTVDPAEASPGVYVIASPDGTRTKIAIR